MAVEIRPARLGDYEAVAAFTRDTWSDRREDGDYIPRVFEDWVESDDESQRTFVADVDGTAAGVIQTVLLSEHEAWAQGMRVDPAHRGKSIGTKLTHAGFDWARERGATVARNMVFSWNVMGLGLSRAAGFEPETEFRWVHPDPDPDASHDYTETGDVHTAWRALQSSRAFDELAGLGLDLNEAWALSEVTKDTLRDAPETIALTDSDGARAAAYRVRDYGRENEDGESVTWADYGVGVWHDTDACEALLAAISRDAAESDIDQVRVLVPEDAAFVSDVAAARVDIGDEPDFVTAADLSADY
ncbi:GNAT family N-acetyltransferase [Salarchaeum sp. JOR-1]|uniref:GNAT family N-acetyltransferase n=1 Tax=Salarchaeum sp. JOR-1 TaxID=2599399 RepID=UPI001198B87E|nr:GNAT family N-acetyltransferase [Salarchaeum sp. JOR-1]QDX40708.1 GNAT family N-acetyltransferase [Salarchaeum sp. JOR-1]